MHLRFETAVAAAPEEVWARFDRELFLALAPSWPPFELKRFDGCQPGNLVEIELRLPFFKQRWISRITEQHSGPDEIYFVDEGVQLPFFLKTWRHWHGIQRRGAGSLIVDDIHFTSPLKSQALFYPQLYAQFKARGPIYRRMFGEG